MDPNSYQQPNLNPHPVASAPQPVLSGGSKKGFPIPKKFLLIGLGVLAFLLLVIIVIKLLAGGDGGSSRDEIVWWGLWEEKEVIEPLIEEYKRINPKANIRYEKQSPQDYRERLINALARGTGPDIFRIHNSWGPMFRGELATVPAGVLSSSEFATSYYPVAVSDLTTNDGIVGIPLMYDGLTLFINEEIFEESGKVPPKTWDEVRVVARELTRKDEEGSITQAGIALGRTENVDHWPEILGLMMLQNGASLSKPQGPLAEGALTFFTIFAGSDGVWDSTLPPSTIYFAGGNLAMYFGPSWRVFEIQQMNPSLRFKAVPLPQLAKEDPNEPDVTYASYWVEAVSERSGNKDIAWDFLKFLSTADSLSKLYQGASLTRGFGAAYPRVDMQPLLVDHPFLGALTSEARDAGSWYLQSRTFDGPTGINSQINKYFEDAVNALNGGTTSPSRALEPVVQGVAQVLSQYGMVVR